jgi:hypothetical protein
MEKERPRGVRELTAYSPVADPGSYSRLDLLRNIAVQKWLNPPTPIFDKILL